MDKNRVKKSKQCELCGTRHAACLVSQSRTTLTQDHVDDLFKKQGWTEKDGIWYCTACTAAVHEIIR